MKTSRKFCASLSYHPSIKRQHHVGQLQRLGAAAILGLVLCGVQTAAWCDDAPAAATQATRKQPRVRVQFQPSEGDELVPRQPATTIIRSNAKSEPDANPETTVKPKTSVRQSIASKLGLNVKPGTTSKTGATASPNTTTRSGATSQLGTSAKPKTIGAKPLAAETSQPKANTDEWHAKGLKYQDTFTQSLAQRSGSAATPSAPAAVLENKPAGTPAASSAPSAVAASAKTSPLAEALQAKLLSLPAPPSTAGPSETHKTPEKTSTPIADAKNTDAELSKTNSKEPIKADAIESGDVTPASAVDAKPAEEHAAIPADAAPVTEKITSKKHKPAVLSLGDLGDSGNLGDPAKAKDPAPVAPAPVITAAQSRGLSKQQAAQAAAPVESPPRAGGMFAAPVGTAIGAAIAAPVGAASVGKSPSAEPKDSTTEPADSESKPVRGWNAKPSASTRSAFDEPGSASLSSEPQSSARPSAPTPEVNQVQSAFSPWTSNPATQNSDASIPPAPVANESTPNADELAAADNPTVNPGTTPDSSELPATLQVDTTGSALESVPSDNTAADSDVAAPHLVLQMVKMIGLRKPTDGGQSSSDSEPSRFTLKEPAKITEPAKLIEPAFGAALPAEAAAPMLAAGPVDAKTTNAETKPGLLDNSEAKEASSTATNSAPTPAGELVGTFPAATANAAPAPPSAFPMTVAELPPPPAEITAAAGKTAEPSFPVQLPTLIGQPASTAAANDGAKLGSVVVLRRDSTSQPSDKTAESADQIPAPPSTESLSSGSRFAELPADKNVAKAESSSSDSIAAHNAAADSQIASDSKTQSGPFSLAELSKHVQVPALAGGKQTPQPQGSDESAKLVSAPMPVHSDAAEATKSTDSTPTVPNAETGKVDSSRAETSRLVAAPSVPVDAPSLLTTAAAPSPDQTKHAQPASPTAGMPAAGTQPDFASLSVPGAERISIAPRETRAIHLDVDATRAESLDPRVCDVIQFNPHELTFVGKQPGLTRIDCWQDGNPDSRKSYLVAVGVDPSKEQQARDQFSKMRVALQDMYPGAGISLTENNGSLVVSGTAASKAEAIAIISLVRRMQTVPVVDALAVDGNR